MNQKLSVNPWWEMWVKPRKTIRAIIDYDNHYGFIGLCFLYGLVQGSHFSQAFSLGAYLPLWGILALIAVLAIPIGAISFSLSSLVLYWTGKLIRGKGSYHDVRAAVSWSSVTVVISAIFLGLMILTFREAFFYRRFAETIFEDWRVVLLVSFLVAEFILAIWMFVIFVLSLAEAQRFSGWMAVINVVLVIIVYFIFFFLLDKLLTLTGGDNIGLLWGNHE